MVWLCFAFTIQSENKVFCSETLKNFNDSYKVEQLLLPGYINTASIILRLLKNKLLTIHALLFANYIFFLVIAYYYNKSLKY